MIVVSEVAKRYAAALFESAADRTKALEELRAVEGVISASEEIARFFASPLINGEEKAAAVAAALEKGSVSAGVKNLAMLLASRNRLGQWAEVVHAYQAKTDETNNVVRGVVRSAAPLVPEQRNAVEARIRQVTGKKLILEYKQDGDLLGGMVAEVGSLTFDDSLETQLRLMNESLKRSAH